jgi:hypothetical protein
MYLKSNLGFADFFFGTEAFKRLQKPIKATHFVQVLTEGILKDWEGVIVVLELALSQHSPPWFPRSDDIVPILRKSAPFFWINSVSKMPVPLISALVSFLKHPEEIYCPTLVAAGLSRNVFDPDVMKLIYDLKLGGVSESNPLPLNEINEPTYIFRAATPSAVKWLLDLLGDEESRRQLHLSNRKTADRNPVTNWYYGDRKLKAAEDHFGTDSSCLISFPNNLNNFVTFGHYCSMFEDLDLLKRAVEATGPNNIAPDTRATFLVLLCGAYATEEVEAHKLMLRYWVDIISEGPEPDFYFLTNLRVDGIEPAALLRIASAQEDMSIDVFDVWVKLRKAVVRQVREKNGLHAEPVAAALLHAIGIIERLNLEERHPLDFYCEFFEEMVLLSSAAGNCPTAYILSHLLEHHPMPTAGRQSLVLDFCRIIDFSSENSQWHSKCAKKLIELTLRTKEYTNSTPETLAALISFWIDFLTEEGLHYKHNGLNIVDLICDNTVAPHLVHFEAWLEKIMRLGGRLTSQERHELDIEALELYKEALREINKPKTN